jgi:hypothetical protein
VCVPHNNRRGRRPSHRPDGDRGEGAGADITHTYPLDQINTAFDVMEKGESYVQATRATRRERMLMRRGLGRHRIRSVVHLF